MNCRINLVSLFVIVVGIAFGNRCANGQNSSAFNVAVTEMNSGHHETALNSFLKIEKSVSNPANERALAANNAAWILARTSNKKIRDPRRAVRIIEPWVKQKNVNSWQVLDTLALAYSGAGRHGEATRYINKAMTRVSYGSGNFASDLQTVVSHMTEINRVALRTNSRPTQSIGELLKPFESDLGKMQTQLEKTWAEIEETDPAKANQLRLEHMNRRNRHMIETMRSLSEIGK